MKSWKRPVSESFIENCTLNGYFPIAQHAPQTGHVPIAQRPSPLSKITMKS